MLADSNASSLRAFPEHFLNKFKVVEKNALLCNAYRIRVMKDDVLEKGWKRIRFISPRIYVFFFNFGKFSVIKGTLPLRWLSTPGPFDCRSNALSSELRRFHTTFLTESIYAYLATDTS